MGWVGGGGFGDAARMMVMMSWWEVMVLGGCLWWVDGWVEVGVVGGSAAVGW